MERIARERERLLRRFAQWTGTPPLLVAVPLLGYDAAAHALTVVLVVLLIAVAVALLWAYERLGLRTLHVAFTLACAGAMAVGYAGGLGGTISGAAVGLLAALAIGVTCGFAHWGRRGAAPAIAGCLLLSLGGAGLVAQPVAVATVAAAVVGMDVLFLFETWLLCAAIANSLRIVEAGERIHAAERRASELSYQRHADARLLHDTVLATLSILAHAGAGVPETVLREQAADDARLLRRLRLGDSPAPQRVGSYVLESKQASRQQTFEPLRTRWRRQGLELSWHGTGEDVLEEEIFSAIELALGACLENVRRHSGSRSATVTLTIEQDVVRAVVSDAGSGFDVDAVPEDRLGLRESVLGRVHSLGGTARVFSVPGAGTTIAMEIPRPGEPA